LYLAIACRDEMDGYGHGGSKLTRKVLVIRVMGRLPWLHLHAIHLVCDVKQFKQITGGMRQHKRHVALEWIPNVASQSDLSTEACSEGNGKLSTKPILRVLTFTFSSLLAT
jgi:hypothetical protein